MAAAMRRWRVLPLAALLWLAGCDRGPASFTVVQGWKDGHVVFATIDTATPSPEVKAAHPWLLTFSTPVKNPTEAGLPKDDEMAALNDWEDALEKELPAACKFIYFGRVTWNSKRDLLYYVDTPDTVEAKLKPFIDDPRTRAFTITSERDEKWEQTAFYLALDQAR